MAPPNWPQLIVEGGFTPGAPVQAGAFTLDDATFGKLDTGILGQSVTWTDLSPYARSGNVDRPANREQGPLWAYQKGAASVVLNNADGRFDPDNASGPYTDGSGNTQLVPMVPVRVRAVWNGVPYPLFSGFADGWQPEDGANYAGRYAQATVAASDGQKVLAGINLATVAGTGAGETSGARIARILNAAMWYTGSEQRQLDAGNVTVQAYAGGDAAWNLLQETADAEIGEVYLNGSGQLVFRERQAIITEDRSVTPQAVFGDSPGTVQADGTELPYASVTRARDDATLANDIQATIAGGSAVQEASDPASETQFLFPRTYARSDLILQSNPDALTWAQWLLYVSKTDEDRFDQLVIQPLRAPADLWPQALGREVGDRIQVWRRPPDVASPVTKDCFIRGIHHDFDVSAGTWTTTFTLQDASKYGSFFVLDDPVLGRLNHNALAA